MASITGRVSRAWRDRVRDALPADLALPEDVWQRRHRLIVAVVLAHAGGIVVFALLVGFRAEHSVLEGALVGALGVAAAWNAPSRTVRASLASVGLLSSSAILVHRRARPARSRGA